MLFTVFTKVLIEETPKDLGISMCVNCWYVVSVWWCWEGGGVIYLVHLSGSSESGLCFSRKYIGQGREREIDHVRRFEIEL